MACDADPAAGGNGGNGVATELDLPASASADQIVQRIERIPFGRFHSRIVAILGLGMLFDAFDVYVISVIAVDITAFHIDDSTIGYIISASYVGQLLGSLLFGYGSEIYGRKPAFVWALSSFGLLSIVAAFSWNVESLIWSRILQGFGIGALPPIAGAPSTCWTAVAIVCDLGGVLVVTPQR